MKKLMIFVFALNILAPLSQAHAGCNPCICGPGGDYKGDVGEWFRNNCPGTERPGSSQPRRPQPTPPKTPGSGRPIGPR